MAQNNGPYTAHTLCFGILSHHFGHFEGPGTLRNTGAIGNLVPVTLGHRLVVTESFPTWVQGDREACGVLLELP